MFINPTVFKRLCTQAYKKLGLHVEHSKNGYYAVAGDYWQIEVLDTYMTNKVKAILIDLIGDLPIKGEGYMFLKGQDSQLEMSGITFKNLTTIFDVCDEKYEETRIMVQMPGCMASIMQETENKEKIFINSVFLNLIDRTVIENEKGECIPELPMGVTGGNSLIWANNIMAVQCYKRYIQYKGEQKIMELLGLSDMTWKFVDADKIAG